MFQLSQAHLLSSMVAAADHKRKAKKETKKREKSVPAHISQPQGWPREHSKFKLAWGRRNLALVSRNPRDSNPYHVLWQNFQRVLQRYRVHKQ